MRNARYAALIRLGIHYMEQQEDAKRHAYEAQYEGNDFRAFEYAREADACSVKLQALGDVAEEIFGRKYDGYMQRVNDRKVR